MKYKCFISLIGNTTSSTTFSVNKAKHLFFLQKLLGKPITLVYYPAEFLGKQINIVYCLAGFLGEQITIVYYLAERLGK